MASEFGDELRRLRREKGMTQEELAERSGASVSTVRGLETGKRSNPRLNTVERLADAMRLGPEDRETLLIAAGLLDPGRSTPPEPDPAAPEPGPTPPASLTSPTDPAEQLARLVAVRWQREEEQRQVQDPSPLPVCWRTAPEALTDHWDIILRRRTRDAAPARPLDLDGQLDQITETFRRIPSGRLVVLGRSGSGKTILALRFVLDHLAARSHTDPVPVIFSIGGWNPTKITLRDWLTAQLTRDHPGYAAQGPDGQSLASALVESGRILPVLDGFDEMAGGLRRPALEALNATTLPLLLTSRPDEYAAAVAETDVLTAAAAIELTDLTLDDLADYLPLTTRKTTRKTTREATLKTTREATPEIGLKATRETTLTVGRPDPAANAWDAVLTELRTRPQTLPASLLTTVLATPLMVALARTIYSDTPDHDPASLLDAERFGSVEELEDHLLDHFLPTVYRHQLPQPPGARARPTFDPDRARHWLGYLAHHLARLDTPDLAWWRLGSGLRPAARTLVSAVMTGLVIGLVDGALSFAIGSPLPFSIVDGTAVGLLSGLMFGFGYWLMFAVKDMAVMPSVMRLRIRGRRAPTPWKSGRRHLIGGLGGLAFGFGYGFVAGMVNTYRWKVGYSAGLNIALVDGVVYGLIFCGAAAITFCFLDHLETPLDIKSAVNPRSLLHTNRRTVITQLLIGAPLFGVVVGLGAGVVVDLLQGHLGQLLWSPTASLVLGTISGLAGTLGYALTLTAWGQWLVLTRIWLPLTGRLPWAVLTFLEDAYQRGILRQAGAVYQFRHARLQHHLAQAHQQRL
ncbi:helix-turn-helix domain-containing protein [Streptomyces cyaneus]|uniref:helix-turn-helix domain-containing protein n=1 Tax=Streptomyces cyaneus TaxID=1904 RepID=UPI000FF878A8|nr:helix-turn-helix transcriptional regulator [Streptomyces cyaneus]